jgi:hypothetical protein
VCSKYLIDYLRKSIALDEARNIRGVSKEEV